MESPEPWPDQEKYGEKMIVNKTDFQAHVAQFPDEIYEEWKEGKILIEKNKPTDYKKLTKNWNLLAKLWAKSNKEEHEKLKNQFR